MSEEKRYEYTVVSHTHWDREWYLPYQKFRIGLVKLIDSLLDILAKDARFKCFTLDGQTVVVEDYLEIRPERENTLKGYVKNQRMFIGPWYTQPDEFLVSGEALIRNLLLGLQMAEKYGGAMMVGYVPDSFGQIAQMPQILQGFGLDAFVFKRGVGDEGEKLKTEFLWRAPDGSEVLAVHLVVGYGGLLDLPSSSQEALRLVQPYKKLLQSKASTNHILVMNGGDHMFPRADLPEKLESFNELLEDGVLVQGSLCDFLEKVRKADPSLDVYKGELRGARYRRVLPGVLSSRIYLKQQNTKTQTLLEYYAEPLATYAWVLGSKYPRSLLQRAWKYLLQNHAHDSICGCSIDEVHRENLARYGWARQICEAIINDSFEAVCSKVCTKMAEDELSAVVVYNPLNWTRTDIVEIEIEEPPTPFEIKDAEGNKIPYQVSEVGKGVFPSDMVYRFFSSGNIPSDPSEVMKNRVKVVFVAEDVPPCGYKTYAIAKAKEKPRFKTTLTCDRNKLENEYFLININKKKGASLNLLDKRTNHVYRDLNLFEDGGDRGDEYYHSSPTRDEIFTTAKTQAEIRLIEKGPVRATVQAKISFILPEALSEDGEERSASTVDCPLSLLISIYPKIPRVDLKTTVENRAKDHRLRAVFPTGLKNVKYAHAHDPFYVIRRPIKPPAGKKWVEKPSATHPQRFFVDVNNSRSGLMIANKGLPEYEVKRNGEATLALTLLRCVGWLSTILTVGPVIPTPEAQCQGRHTFEYSIIPHKGTWQTSKAYREAYDFNAPLLAFGTTVHEGELPAEVSFVNVEPDTLILTAVKRAEREGVFTMRFYNVSDETVQGKIGAFKGMKEAWKADLNERNIRRMTPENGEVGLNVAPHRIVTLKLKGVVLRGQTEEPGVR